MTKRNANTAYMEHSAASGMKDVATAPSAIATPITDRPPIQSARIPPGICVIM